MLELAQVRKRYDNVKKNDVVQAELISREPRKKSIEKTNKQDEW